MNVPFHIGVVILWGCLAATAAEAEEPAPGSASETAAEPEATGEPETAAEAEPAAEPEAAVEPEPEPEPAEPSGLWAWLDRGKTTSQGELGVEGRSFDEDGVEATEDAGLGMFGRLEWRHKRTLVEAKLRVYGRLDALDERRTVLLAEEAWLQLRKGTFRVRVGADLINWTATEAFHPADVINARNLDSDLESLEKVGEPMVAVQWGINDTTTVQVMYMPGYVDTLFASPASRLSFTPPGIDLSERILRSDRDGKFTSRRFGHQGAVRLQKTVGGADLAVFALEQMDRLQPLIAVELGDLQPRPLFQTVRQVGGTYQHALGPILLKSEAAYRWFRSPEGVTPGFIYPLSGSSDVPKRNHGTIAVGLEHGRPHQSGKESTLLLEGQVVLGPRKEIIESLTPFQRDVLVAYRLAWNDLHSREVMLGGLWDIQYADQLLLTASYRQRLGETWTVQAALRLYMAGDRSNTGLTALEGADHVRLALIRHF